MRENSWKTLTVLSSTIFKRDSSPVQVLGDPERRRRHRQIRGERRKWRRHRGLPRRGLRRRPLETRAQARLADGYSQIFRIVCVWPFGLLDYGSATLRCKIRSLPFLGLRPHALHPGAIQGKEGIKFCHLATLLKLSKFPS